MEHLEERCTPTQITLTSVADNTLYEETSQSSQLSNGAGQHFYAGETNQAAGINIRRGLLKFDLSSVPAGSTITAATLTLHMSKSAAGSGAQNNALHLLLQGWGEGTSNAGSGGTGSGEGDGVSATTNDATWLDTFFSTNNPPTWTTAGGTFSSTVSATTSVNSVGFYSWSSTQLTADVQGWVNQSSANFGWILLGNETTLKTAKQFDTRENTTTANRPTLVVTYTAPPTVAGLNPTSGPASGGTSVVVTGTGFTGATAVSFGGAAATSFMVNSDMQITATDPAGSGVVDVTVTIPIGGTSATSSADKFTYVAAPTVTGLSPTSGPATGGTSVVITGTGFTGATAVSFGGTAATSFMVNSSTQITAIDPAGSGVVDVTVTIPVGGTSATSSNDQFTYIASTTTAVTSNPVGPITQGTSATFTATISNANPGNVGTVSFYFDFGQPDQFQIGGAVNVNNGSATSAATTALPAGSDVITAIYSGGPGFAGSQGTVTIQVNSSAPPPSVTNVVINQDISALYNAAGQPFAGAQRSMVNDIVYTFSEAVSILGTGTDPNVFTVAVASGWTGTVPTLSWTAVVGSGDTQWAVTFSGGSVTGGSIANGAYTITVTDLGSITAESDGQAVTVTPGTAPGTGNPDYATQQFYRLFGDINGDEFVNAADNVKFKNALTTYNAAFDFSQDGFVNASDNARFKADLTVNFSGFMPTI
jgi:Bacterial Ig-like domain (group 3)/IPT/TIG domain/Dockerin type I domain